MRTVNATATAVTAALAVAAAGVAVGRLAADAALKAAPGRPLPTEPRLTVHGTAAGQITLTRDLATLRPGRYGLTGNGTHAIVGPVLPDAEHTADTVVRRLERVTRGTLEPGDRAWLTPSVHIGDPGTALGLDHTDVEVRGELGALPAWFVPGSRDTWIIAVHGLGTTREHTLNVMGFLHRHHFPVLALAYRGDAGAPRPPDGLGHLGETEWHDLDAAIHHAVRSGARRVVLHGWSTGATMALRAAARSELRDLVSGLVLDSPVLHWETTLRALAAARRTPSVLLPLAVRAAQGRMKASPQHHTGTSGTPGTTGTTGTTETPRAPETPGATGASGTARPATAPEGPRIPTLVVHGPDDRVAPWQLSRRLADAGPGPVTLHTVRNAPHGAMWNADPDAYEEVLRRFLTPLV
ncbi:alpha/beta hydrolase [Streptomyces sp. NPDC005925]|uniref:alpha/beta hydrolase family protein n=1 Tax=Streptomyces sp. NPDC005925 TaxID=3157172 RepID=UPI0033D30D0E